MSAGGRKKRLPETPSLCYHCPIRSAPDKDRIVLTVPRPNSEGLMTIVDGTGRKAVDSHHQQALSHPSADFTCARQCRGSS